MNSFMLIVSYKKSRTLILWSLLAALVVLALIAYKLFAGYAKVQDYRQAAHYLEQNDVVQAYGYYLKARNNRWMQYKEKETEAAIDKLKPVEEIQNKLLGILDNNGENNNPAKSYDDYQKLAGTAAARGGQFEKIFNELSKQYRIDAHFTNAYSTYKKTLEQQLQAETKKAAFSDKTVIAYLLIPELYFGGAAEKETALRAAFEPYDQGRLAAKADGSGIEALLAEGARLLDFYKQEGINADWVYPGVEDYTLSYLKKLEDKGDLSVFFRNAKAIEGSKLIAARGKAIRSYIQSVYSGQVKQAKQLVSESKYEEAIAAYTLLGDYKDVSKELQNIEIRWNTQEPERILAKASPGVSFDYVISGKNQFGAIVYAIGAADGQLVLARMLPDLSIDKREAQLGEGFQVREIRLEENLSPSGRLVLLAEGQSSTRQGRYAAYEISDSALINLFDFEADGFRIDKPGTLIVTNDVNEGAGQEALYTYENGQYQFSGIKPDYTEIQLTDLLQYSGQKVRFTCDIFTTDGDRSVVLFNEEYIILTGAPGLQPGKATITGTWVGNDVVSRDGEEITAYRVEVSSYVQSITNTQQ